MAAYVGALRTYLRERLADDVVSSVASRAV